MQNGHVGFMLSCYDAKLCYDPRTDTFQARWLSKHPLSNSMGAIIVLLPSFFYLFLLW